jgi:hypothetical protein
MALWRQKNEWNALYVRAWRAGLRDDARVLCTLVSRWFSGDPDEGLRRGGLTHPPQARALFRAYLGLGPKDPLPAPWEQDARAGRQVRHWLTKRDVALNAHIGAVIVGARQQGRPFRSFAELQDFLLRSASATGAMIPKSRMGFWKLCRRRLGLSLSRLSGGEIEALRSPRLLVQFRVSPKPPGRPGPRLSQGL